MTVYELLERYELMARGEFPVDPTARKAPLFPSDKRGEILSAIWTARQLLSGATVVRPLDHQLGFIAGALWGIGWYSKEELGL